MTREEVKTKILSIVYDYTEIEADKINMTEPLKLSVGLDSFAMISMVSAIEQEFGISMPDEVLGKIKTMDDIVDYVAAQ